MTSNFYLFIHLFVLFSETMSMFDNLKPSTPSDITRVLKKYNADKSPNKIDMASGGKFLKIAFQYED